MIDNWKSRFVKKLLIYGVPNFLLFAAVCKYGPPLAIPFFLPALGFGIGIPMVEVIAHFMPNIFWSQGGTCKRQPTFSIARGLKKQGKFDECLAILQEMANEDPQEVNIWLEMLETTLLDMKEIARAEPIYREAVSVLERQDARDLVTRFYRNVVG